MRKTLLAAAAVCGSLAAAHAGDVKGNYAVKGIGGVTCERYALDRNEGSRDFYVAAGWIDGYLTAHNERASETYDIAPWQTTELLAGMLESYCKAHSAEPVFVAVRKLASSLEAGRLSQQSEVVTAEHDGEGTVIYAEVLRRAQRKLAELGHYGGAPDGTYGPKTRAALLAFQGSRGIPASGLPDQPTLYGLFRSR